MSIGKDIKNILETYDCILSNRKIIREAMVSLNRTNYDNVKFDNDSTQYDKVNNVLLSDIQKASECAGVTVTITTASSGHRQTTTSGYQSRHVTGNAVDIAIINNTTYDNSQFKSLADKFVECLTKMGYDLNRESGNDKAVLWQTQGHFNHVHVSNKSTSPSSTEPEIQDKEYQQDGEEYKDTSQDNDNGINKVAMDFMKKMIKLL